MFRTRVSLAGLLAAVALAGCSSGGSSHTSGATAPAAVQNDGRCQASGAEFAIGKPGTPALLEQARQASGSQIARLLKPNDMVTLEYRSERLNLTLDPQGVVSRVNCG